MAPAAGPAAAGEAPRRRRGLPWRSSRARALVVASLALAAQVRPASARQTIRPLVSAVAVELDGAGATATLESGGPRAPPLLASAAGGAPAPAADAAVAAAPPLENASAEEQLVTAAHNLTDAIHQEATAISHATGKLRWDEEVYNRTSTAKRDLVAKYSEAHEEAINASETLQAYSADLAAARARRDRLRTVTEELQQRLVHAGAEYMAAEEEYQRKLQAMPWLQGAAERTNATDADLGVKRQQAIEAAEAARSSVALHANELQRAIDELNGLNEYLKSVEAQLPGVLRNSARGLGAPPAFRAAACLAAAVAAAALRRL